MAYSIYPETRDQWDIFCYYENAFSDEECDRIIALGNSLAKVEAKISAPGEEVENPIVRSSKVSWLEWNQERDWLFAKLTAYAKDANTSRFKFNLHGYLEALQYTEYEKNGHYRWHQDSGAKSFSIRKLSQVVLLSPEDAYEGGDLEFFSLAGQKPIRKRGTVFCFPSFEQHRVTEVTSGLRQSLVAWVSGPPFC